MGSVCSQTTDTHRHMQHTGNTAEIHLLNAWARTTPTFPPAKASVSTPWL